MRTHVHNPRVDIEEKLPHCLNRDNVSYIRKIITGYDISPLQLKNTSANCDWCTLTIKINNKDENLYIKVVNVSPINGDHPFIDVINGVVLHEIAPEISMEFVDCFIAYKQNNNLLLNPDIGNIQNSQCRDAINTQIINNYMLNNSYIPKPIIRDDQMTKVYVIISKVINGIALKECIQKTNQSNINHLFEILDTFICEYSRLYHLHGIMHNDLHFDNVFYDIKLRKLIIIDYGRMSISSMNSLSRPLLGKFNKEIENVMSSLYISPSPFNNAYTEILTLTNSTFPILDMCECDYYLMDCMTIAGNLYTQFKSNIFIYTTYKPIFDCIHQNICEVRTNYEIKITKQINSLNCLNFIDSKRDLTQYEFNIFKFIIQGLNLISKACEYIHLRNPLFNNLYSRNHVNYHQSYKFDLTNVQSPIYSYFQWQYPPSDFKRFINSIRPQKIEKDFLIGGGRKQSIKDKYMKYINMKSKNNTMYGGKTFEGASKIAGTNAEAEEQKAPPRNTFSPLLRNEVTNAIIKECMDNNLNIKIGDKMYVLTNKEDLASVQRMAQPPQGRP